MTSISPICKKCKNFISALKSPTYRDFMIKKSLKSKTSTSHTWAPLRSPGIDSEESIPPGWNRFLGSLKGLQIRAQHAVTVTVETITALRNYLKAQYCANWPLALSILRVEGFDKSSSLFFFFRL
jgi:hypothetical protein